MVSGVNSFVENTQLDKINKKTGMKVELLEGQRLTNYKSIADFDTDMDCILSKQELEQLNNVKDKNPMMEQLLSTFEKYQAENPSANGIKLSSEYIMKLVDNYTDNITEDLSAYANKAFT